MTVRVINRETGVPCLAIIGDSIPNGSIDGDAGATEEYGWVLRALDDEVAFVRISVGGSNATNYLTSETDRRRPLVNGCTTALCAHGTNDIFVVGRTLAQLQVSWIAQWQDCLDRGVRKVLQATILPRTDSSNVPLAQEAHRTNANAWLRAGAPMSGGAAVAIGTGGALLAGDAGHPLDADSIIDASVAVEDADPQKCLLTGGTFWADTYTHPNSAGHARIAASAGPDLRAAIV